jgi:hypothetical protein
MQAHYTFSKALGYASYAASQVDVLGQDTYNRKLEHSVLMTDVPHAFATNFTYELPFGPGRRLLNQKGPVGLLAGGWSVAGIVRYQSGFPLPISMSNTLGIFSQRQRPNRVIGQEPASGITNGDFNPSTDRRINLSAFAAPAPYSFGTAAPTIQDLRTFPVFNEDLALTKDTRIAEKVRLETYGQFFNIFNRHRFHTFDGNFSSNSFGRASGVSLPRFIQLGMRLRF